MIIHIRKTTQRMFDKNGDELLGECSFPTPRRMLIRVSTRRNKTINGYGMTLLHEMLHAWINMLELHGFRSDDAKEENFILAVEKVVVKLFIIFFKRRKR